MKLDLPKKWFEKHINDEGNGEIRAGSLNIFLKELESLGPWSHGVDSLPLEARQAIKNSKRDYLKKDIPNV